MQNQHSGQLGPTDAERPAWWQHSAQAVAQQLNSDPGQGLAAEAAEARLASVGPNVLEAEPGKAWWSIVLGQFANTMIVVLLLAAGVTAVVGDVVDAVVIGAIVTLNAIVGFVQEYRAEQAMASLGAMVSPHARVVRGGWPMEVPAKDVVPGDVLVLEAGDLVPADARLIECPNLKVDEAPLTGESLPVDKDPGCLGAEEGKTLGDRRNMVFRGTSVVYGRARAVVVATGMETAIGTIAGLLKTHQAPPTPLQVRLGVLGRRLAIAAVVVCLAVFLAGLARGEDPAMMFLTAVSLAVAAIPEALPAVVTIALALGAQRMVAHGAILRNLPAVETLGSVTVICSDKTGTLTQGRMSVERVWALDWEASIEGIGYAPTGRVVVAGQEVVGPVAPGFERLLQAAVLCNDASLVPPEVAGGNWAVVGDPTEGALLTLAARAGVDPGQRTASLPRIDEVPFDSERKRMTTVHRAGHEVLVASKGALEAVLAVCTRVATEPGDSELTGDALARVQGQAEIYASSGYRVLALAERRTASSGRDAQWESELVLLGLVAMADPPRAASQQAVAACQRAGIRPVMITGDHPATAVAIARRLELLGDGETMSGRDLSVAGESGLAERVNEVSVYSRVSPEQKLNIVHAWQRAGAVVAMTGDGVNDAPALRAADIGVAMGKTGTEVARQAADMLLTDDDFATIVTAVGEGRRIYDNIRRFVRYTLTSNTGEIWVMVLGPFIGLPLPLIPVQILWINLVTDGLPGLALAMEPMDPGAMSRKARQPGESIFAHGLWQQVLAMGLLMALIPLALGLWGQATDRPWQTMVFISLTMSQLGNAMAVRSETASLGQLGLRSNLPLLGAVAGTLAVQVAVLYWQPASSLLKVEPLAVTDLCIVLAASCGVFFAIELEKAIRRFRQRSRAQAL